MPCLVVLFALIGPRVALFITWLFSDLISRALEAWYVGFLGFLFLPWTTLAYVMFFTYGIDPEVTGFEWFIVGLAFVADITSYVGSQRSRNW